MVLKKSSRRPSDRLVVRDGEFPDVVRLGDPHSQWRDLYHLLLTIPWPGFVALLGLIYLVINILFAVAYRLGGDCIANSDGTTLINAFFFSVQTMASIGYGAMYPTTTYANLLVVIEAFAGLLFIAMATGLIFTRFSLPSARILFSHYAVISKHQGIDTLMFRTANKRRNRILEANLWVTLVRDEFTQEGESFRRFYDLQLIRSHTPLFALTWTAMHPIGPDSPLYGQTPESLASGNGEIVVALTGIDETVSQTIHARHSFISSEILWNHRLVDILSWTEDNRRSIDFNHFDAVIPQESTPYFSKTDHGATNGRISPQD